MSHRTAKVTSAVFASLLAGIALPTAVHSAVGPADSCLSGPKGAPPPGGHWYYRVDRATKRQCWFLGEAKQKPSRANPQNASSSKEPQRSIADAHAELPMPQTRVEQDTAVPAAEQTPANAASIDSDPQVDAEYASPQRSIVASRWPESSGMEASAGSGPAVGDSLADGPPNSGATPLPALAAVSLATADSSPEKPSDSIQMLLLVVIGALSLAGLMGSAVYRLGGARWNRRREIDFNRQAILDYAESGGRSPVAYAADDARRKIAAMIARLPQSTDGLRGPAIAPIAAATPVRSLRDRSVVRA